MSGSLAHVAEFSNQRLTTVAVMTDDDGTKSVAYSKLIPVLVEAIKAQQAQIEDLKQARATQPGGVDARDAPGST